MSNYELTTKERAYINDLLHREPTEFETWLLAYIWRDAALDTAISSYLEDLIYCHRTLPILPIDDQQSCVVNIQNYSRWFATLQDTPWEEISHLPQILYERINRPIQAMGAMPLAHLYTFHFEAPQQTKTKTLIKQLVVNVIKYSMQGHHLAVSGDLFFNRSFAHNALVNTLVLGVVKTEDIALPENKHSSNSLYLVHLSEDCLPATTKSSQQEQRVTQFLLQCIHERLLEGVVNIEDGQLLKALSSLCTKGKKGVRIDLANLKTEQYFTAENILTNMRGPKWVLSIRLSRLKQFTSLLKEQDVYAKEIGQITDSTDFELLDGSRQLVKIPCSLLMDYPFKQTLDIKTQRKKGAKYQQDKISEPDDLQKVAWQLLEHSNLASRKWLFSAPPTQSGNSTQKKHLPSDALITKIPDSSKCLAIGFSSNTRYCKANPQRGTILAVVEAVRNLVCSGAEPLGIAVCLNLGRKDDETTLWQYTEMVQGLKIVCEKYQLPVVSPSSINLSFDNFSLVNDKIRSVDPTPLVAAVGLPVEGKLPTSMTFRHKGDMIFLLGETRNNLASSEYLSIVHGVEQSPVPFFNLHTSYQLQDIVKTLIKEDLLCSAHGISRGGLFLALVECCLDSDLGFDITTDAENRDDAFLFGEAQNRIVVSVTPEKETQFIDYMMDIDFPFSTLGHVTRGEMRIDDQSYGYARDARKVYQKSLKKQLGE